MVEVLDTAALLHWPMSRLRGAHAVPSQLKELMRLSEARGLLIESSEVIWMHPSREAIGQARAAASVTGDLPRLSDVDLEVLALAMELEATLVTDDYRLQNVARSEAMSFLSVATRGTTGRWTWHAVCTGCRHRAKITEHAIRSTTGAVHTCERCGSTMNVRRDRR